MSEYRVEPQQLTPRILPELKDSSSAVVVPTPQGLFAMRAWAFADGSEHISLQALDQDGAPRPPEAGGEENAPAVRVHSECATGDIFGSYRCDCGPQLDQGLETIQQLGGYLIYVRNHEGRGIGLVNKLRAYALQDSGLDTLDANLALGLEADARDYSQAAEILRQLGLSRIRLISNNPTKAQALGELGITVIDLVPDEIPPRAENAHYLETKRARMHHKLTLTKENS